MAKPSSRTADRTLPCWKPVANGDEWEAVRAKAYRKAWGAHTPADTYAAIELALRALGDQHSYLLSPDRVAELEAGSLAAASPDPWGEILEGRLGYLSVPGWAGFRDLAHEAPPLKSWHDVAQERRHRHLCPTP